MQKKNYEDFQPKLLPPASPSEIADLETKLGFQLPPSFREFLRLHNGWENFGAVKLLGTTDFFSTWTEQQKSYYKDVDAGAPFEAGAVPFAMGEADMINHFWAFDPSAKATNGELEVVDWDHGYEESRLSSFIDFLQNQLEIERDRAE